MTSSPRAAHYAALPIGDRGRGHHWTAASALAALLLYCREEGHPPQSKDLRGTQGLPTPDRVIQLFGSVAAFVALAFPGPPASRTTTPDCTCLVCGRAWPSPDKTKFRKCPDCQKRPWEPDDSWMNGAGTYPLADWREQRSQRRAAAGRHV